MKDVHAAGAYVNRRVEVHMISLVRDPDSDAEGKASIHRNKIAALTAEKNAAEARLEAAERMQKMRPEAKMTKSSRRESPSSFCCFSPKSHVLTTTGRTQKNDDSLDGLSL